MGNELFCNKSHRKTIAGIWEYNLVASMEWQEVAKRLKSKCYVLKTFFIKLYFSNKLLAKC